MTEQEWLCATDPNPMLLFLSDKTSGRKRRLLTCAFCREMGRGIEDGRFWRGIDCGERMADCEDNSTTLEAVQDDVLQAMTEAMGCDNSTFSACVKVLGSLSFPDPLDGFVQPVPTIWDRVKEIGRNVYDRLSVGVSYIKRRPNPESWCGITRDIIGNPFRPVVLDPSWHTSDVLALAKGIYENRDFSVMPILADALQDAGCENAEVLSHCQSSGPHVRGCWVVDALLGKE